MRGAVWERAPGVSAGLVSERHHTRAGPAKKGDEILREKIFNLNLSGNEVYNSALSL